MKKRNVAFITGVTGQDGSYLCELLLNKGYIVHGAIRRASSFNTWRIDHLMNNENFFTHYCDLSDSSNIFRLIHEIEPTEIYNLAAQSHVGVSFYQPEYTGDVTAMGALRLLEAMRSLKYKCKYYQASTSEMFGGFKATVPQHEATAFYPRSPYAAAKLYAHWLTVNYRESYKLFACSGLLFNHESPRRGENFVTRKIALNVARINGNDKTPLLLGNLYAKRDWGHAKDYVEAMWLMLQQNSPDDFVIATGKSYSVKEFVEAAFKVIGKEIIWSGSGIDEVGSDSSTGDILVKIDPLYFRPSEVEYLCGDPTKARQKLGWSPSTDFEALVTEMVNHELNL
jgi:GDPmannose 4,6-dehydratase